MFLSSSKELEVLFGYVQISQKELLNKYIGASEQSVREVFERAAIASPCNFMHLSSRFFGIQFNCELYRHIFHIIFLNVYGYIL